MVEKENTSTHPDEGGREVSSADTAAEQVEGQETPAMAVEEATAEKAVDSSSTEPDVEAAESDEDAGGVVKAPSDNGNNQDQAPSEPEHTGPVTTRLIFKAPDIKPLPPRPKVEKQEDSADSGNGSRRRSRRRKGADGDEARQSEPELITEPQKVKGSTRLEAKKQRRRDGRDAGRRRAVVTEAEFLARRESVDRKMIVRSKSGRIQIGVLEDDILAEHYVARSQESSLIGNVYLGKVQNVLPSMEAAFVDIGRGRNAVLYSGEVDWDSVETGNQPRRIELALKAGDKVLVQVTKDPVGHKGARLTSQISLPGRYLVYVPNGSMNGISRKLPDTERARLKKILKAILPENAGVIVRTAAEGATEEQLTRDVTRLTKQWESIQKQVENGHAPALLHSEPDLLIKIVRDVFNEDFQSMVIAGGDAKQTIEKYLAQVAPDLLDRVESYSGGKDVFDEFRITEQIEKALDRKVWLPSGGSLVIDRTEAMTVVDVNTGKFVGSGGNLEETVTKNNLEAAEEIVRQLRLRDIGGIIVVDFIDMVLESNRDLVLRRLVECLSRDRTKHQVAEVTSLGLVQMTRKKLGLGLLETFSEACDACSGRGVIVHHEPVAKHRHSNSDSGGRKRRGSQGSSNGNNGAQQKSSAHSITDDAKKALSQIAASTIHAEDEVGQKSVVGKTESSEASEAPKTRSEKSQQEQTPQSESEKVAILDIPIEPGHAAETRQVDKQAAEDLLGSVLDALPEPKKPGQGRNRSRRVTTAALTGVPVSARTDNGEKTDASESD